MLLTAKLHIEGHDNENDGILLLSAVYRFQQDVDQRGLTNSRVQGGVINLSFISIDDSALLQWMVSENADKNGKIVFSGTDHSKPFRTIEFKDARLVNYYEEYFDKQDMVTKITISVRELTISGVKHMNVWSGYDTV